MAIKGRIILVEIKVNGDGNEFFQKEVKIIKPRDGHHGREVEDESKHVLSESEQFRPFRLIPGRFGRSCPVNRLILSTQPNPQVQATTMKTRPPFSNPTKAKMKKPVSSV
jgi:hypothetical protein